MGADFSVPPVSDTTVMTSFDQSLLMRKLSADDADEVVFADQAAPLLQELVGRGAALGWVEPPPADEVATLLREVGAAADAGDACLVAAWHGDTLAGLGYWRRYARPTHHPHADVEKVAVAPAHQRQGVGRALTTELITAAGESGIEVLTLDFRGDNSRAAALYRYLGFTEYGRLPRFVAVDNARYDKILYALDLRTH